MGAALAMFCNYGKEDTHIHTHTHRHTHTHMTPFVKGPFGVVHQLSPVQRMSLSRADTMRH